MHYRAKIQLFIVSCEKIGRMNTFGRIFRVSVFGESHSGTLGCTIDGVPEGIELEASDFAADIRRRAPGAAGTTERREEDIPQIISGLFDGHTTGAPLTILFENKDVRDEDYDQFDAVPRPGHADYTASVKWDWANDPRGGGMFSGRMTLPLVAAGVVAKKVLDGIRFSAKLLEVGGRKDWKQLLEKTAAEGLSRRHSRMPRFRSAHRPWRTFLRLGGVPDFPYGVFHPRRKGHRVRRRIPRRRDERLGAQRSLRFRGPCEERFGRRQRRHFKRLRHRVQGRFQAQLQHIPSPEDLEFQGREGMHAEDCRTSRRLLRPQVPRHSGGRRGDSPRGPGLILQRRYPEAEDVLARLEEIFVQRPSAPGIDTSEAHLRHVYVQPGRSPAALPGANLPEKFERMVLRSVDRKVEVPSAKRQCRSAEKAVRGNPESDAFVGIDVHPLQTVMGA